MSMSEDKDNKRHVHCAECHHAIYEGQETHTGQTVVWVENNKGGIEPVPRPVPVCQTCWQRLKAGHLERAVPKLIVPKHNGG
jgi:hypothetical protein